MKKLVASIEEHLAFYGPHGCDVKSLWPVMQAIDKTKSKCWRALAGMNSLEFYKDNQKLDKPRDIKLEQADSIRVIAPAEIRKKILTKSMTNQKYPLNANQFTVLDKIANTRHDGILQIQVARELGVDSRAVYPVIKRLLEQGLIIKTRVSTHKTWTNLLHHIRFSPEDEMVNTPTMDQQGIIHYDTLQKQLVNVLSEAKDNMIPMAELFNIFGFTTKQQKKWMSRFFVRAIEEGYIEKKRLMIDGIKTVCIKLLYSPIQKEGQEATPKQQEDTESCTSKKRKRKYGQFYGKELQDRIVQVIGEADDKGMTRKQVEQALPEGTPSAIKQFLKSINSMDEEDNEDQQLFHVIEAQGRTRCYRYFTRAGLEKFLKNRNQTLSGPNHDQERADENEISTVPDKEHHGDISPTSNGIKRALTTTTNEQNETPSKRIKTVTEGGFTKGTRQSMKGTNVTMDNRRNAMATIVLRDKVRELHGDLREEIMVQAGELESNHVIARATLMRMAERLEKTKVIRIMKTVVPTLTGAMDTKILLLHPDVGDNDEIVKQYMERLKMNRMVKPIVCRKLPELEVYDRGESSAPSTSDEMTPRQHAALQKVYGAPDKYWREVALRHGWLSSRWLRARVLHEYLFSQKNSNNAIDFGHVISHMPLDVYRKAFGICSYSEEAEEFLRNNDNPEIPISMIPSNLHRTIITSTTRLRHRLFKLLSILEALELMEPHTLTRPITEELPTITLTHIGRIRNFLDISRPILKEIEFNTIDNVKTFWDELQFTCTCEYTRTTGTPRGQGETEDPLNSITISRTWGIHILLNPQQRQLLESHVDRIKGQAPCDDDKLILHLSRQVSIAPSRVKRYFEGIVRLHHGGPSSRSARKNRSIEHGNNLGKAAISGQGVQAYKSNNIEQTFTPTRRYLRHRFPTSSADPLARPKHYRKWKETEQDVLIHAFTIMRQRADALNIPIAWKPIEQVLPSWDYETCRRRLAHMKSNFPQLARELNNLKRQWMKIYRNGIQSGELVDKRPWDIVDFDLPGQLEYFVTKLHASPIQVNTSLDPLPRDRQELVDLFNIAFSIPYQPMETMLTAHGDQSTPQPDASHDLISATSNLITQIAVIIKMVLLTATCDYDPKIAHTLLERFTHEETSDATRYLRDAEVLIKNRSFGANRMIPGRQYNFSEKFLKKFTGSLYPSRLLQLANDFYQGLESNVDLNRDQISGAAMAVILDMLSAGQLQVTLKNDEQYFKTHYNLTLAEIVDDNLSSRLINQGFDVVLKTKQPSISREEHAEPFDADISMPPMKAIDALDPDTRYVYDLIDDCGKDGVTLLDLKGRLEMPDSKIMQATSKLISQSLVIRVGFSELRLVTARHVQHWTVPLEDNMHFHPRMWRNIHGKTIPAVLEGCAEAVFQHILSTPGIKQSQLCDIFKGYMATIELLDVLQYMEQRKAIKSKHFYEVKKVQLFGQRLFSKPLDNKIVHDTIIHYWPLSGYYKSILVTK